MRFGTTPSRRGFTLVEFLVVIAVVAILAAILLPHDRFPDIRGMGPDAKMAQAVSNMVEIGRAFEMYRLDWDGRYPVAHNLHEEPQWEPMSYHSHSEDDYGNLVGYWAKFFWEVLEPYVDDFDVFHCPLDTAIGTSYGQADSMWEYWTERNKAFSDYGRGAEGAKASSYCWNGGLGWTNLWEYNPDANDDDPDTFRPRGYGSWYRTYGSTGGPSAKTYDYIKKPHYRYLLFGWIGFWYLSREENGSYYSGGWPVIFCDGHYDFLHYLNFDETAHMNRGNPDKDARYAWWTPPESELEPLD